MSTLMLADLGRECSVDEIRERVSQISLEVGLRYVTVLSSNILKGNLGEWQSRLNSFNLPLLAKAFVLWGNIEGGRALADEDLIWLLRAINSLPWHSRLAADMALDESVLSMLIRQGFIRLQTDDPLDASIARTWMMFHDLVIEGGLAVPDPSGELRNLLGSSAEELWALGFAVWSFHLTTTTVDGRAWLFDPHDFVQDGPRRDERNALLVRVLERISLEPEQYRSKYALENSKYRDMRDRDGYWISEFNILRDFPLVRLPGGRYTAPFPNFALTRVLDGFYYDLLEEYARKKRESNAGGNAYDNDMCTTLGMLYEKYVGRQLGQLNTSGDQLRGEFEYGNRRQKSLSTDWILSRPGKLPVLFECKARVAVLDVQRYANVQELRTEISKAIGKATKQLARFIQAVDARVPGLEQYHGQVYFIGAVVLQAPLPFHMVPDIRNLIEQVAIEMEPLWARFRNRIHFVPLSIRELETAVATELQYGIMIEDQLVSYARYREQARRVERWDGKNMPVFPRNLEEYLQEEHGQNRRIVNPLCTRVFNGFCDFCMNFFFAEGSEQTNRELFIATQRLAYQFWEGRGQPLDDDQSDWYEAERLIVEDHRRYLVLD